MTDSGFPNGVAAGDVDQASAVLWARSTNLGTATFEYATDPDFATIAGTGAVEVTDPLLPVKLEIAGLDAGTTYYYRVTDAADVVALGRFNTAAELGDFAGLTFGVSGDWRGELTPYPALANVDERDLDFFVALGDTAYADFPSPAVPKAQAETLAEFREKQAEVYSADGGANTLADLRASTAIFATIDDHEVTNDFAGGADPDSDPRFAGSPADFINDSELYNNGIRAFQDYNPIRTDAYGDTGDARTAGEARLYRFTTHGSDAASFVLDARSFRDEELTGPSPLDPASVAQYIGQTFDPARTMLGAAQFAELKQDLLTAQEAGVTWKFIFVPEPIQNLGPIESQDRFEGYAAERNALLKFIADNDISNVIFVAADVHAHIVNNLTYQDVPGGPQIATSAIEVVTGAVAFDAPFGFQVAEFAAQLGFITPQQKAFYDSLPVAPDGDNLPDDKDDFIKNLFDGQIAQFGYDPIGLDSNLPQTDGLIDARLLQGDYFAAHQFGWTEFKIDAATQQLRVTTYGVDPYSEAEAEADPAAIAARAPGVIAEFTLTPLVPIHAIQGAGHQSSFAGATVMTSGIVTARAANGFYLQDPEGDGDLATSEGIFVFTGSAPPATVVVGAELQVTGRAAEFLPGGAATNLTITQIDQVSSIAVLSTGNALPEATVIGAAGRTPPNQVIDDDGFGSFDPAADGIDFYESLEGMLVQVNEAAVVGSTNRFGEIVVVADGGDDAGPRTAAGGLYVGPGDFNPERIQIDDTLVADEPAVNVGDRFEAPITGVVSYSFGNYEVLNTTALPSVTPGGNGPETTALVGTADQLTVATFNVENLNPQVGEPGGAVDRLDRLAQLIVTNMAAPDILALEEMQDNNGATNNGAVAGNQTFEDLIAAIEAAGGPGYQFVQIDPQNNQDGGQPGANIRVGFLYNPDRVTFVPQGAADADDANGVVVVGNDAALTVNPGRVDPTNPAFNDDPVTGTEGARKPLAAEFIFNGQKIFVVANHLKSKSGDTPLFGSTQPPVETTAAQRAAQAQILNDFVAAILTADPSANIIVAGDLNDFEFSTALQVLKGDQLTNLIEQVPQSDRYSFNFEGNSQVLDHVLVSDNLSAGAAPEVDIVHVNVDFAESNRASDHDPIVTRFTFAPAADVAGGSGSQTLAGGSGDDTIDGGTGTDELDGSTGDDKLDGGSGADTVVGGFGNDSVSGGGGNDLMSGGVDGDLLSGGSGSDTLDGGTGNDTLVGGSGGDLFQLSPGDGADVIADFGCGRDVVDLEGFGLAGFDVLLGKAAQDGGNIVIDFGGGDLLTLLDRELDDLEAEDFAGFDAAMAAALQAEPAALAATAEIAPAGVYRLQILHASDLEGSVDAIDRAANFAAIVDMLEDSHANSILLGAGDNWIPGPFFNAAGDPSVQPALQAAYGELFDFPAAVANSIRADVGRVDVSIMTILGFDASALGNHEFDAGTSTIASILGPDIRDSNGDGVLDQVRWLGAQFPYLSANLDFSADAALSPLFTDQVLDSRVFESDLTDLPGSRADKRIAAATIIEEGGEKIGVVGATTPLLASISSPGATEVKDPGAGTNDMPALAQILQPVIDGLLAEGVNKIILVSHLQQIALEKELATLLDGVDVIIAGGSSTLLADDTDALQPGDLAAGGYPFVTQNAGGDPVLIVSTDQEYKYVGRLVVDFDAEGRIIADSVDPVVSGAYATTDAVVDSLWGAADPFAEGTKGDQVADLVAAVGGVVTAQDGNILGRTDVFLEGRRTEVRTEETNLGNLTADANLAYAQVVDATVMVSIRNGGGIRDLIGSIDGVTGAELPPDANPDSGKEAGEISQLDIANALRFNNGLTLLTVTAEQLLQVMEHAVAASAPGATPGQFAQIGGLAYSFDATLAVGQRVLSLAITDADGNVVDVIAENGDIVGDAERAIRIVTLNFLANGGDGYPFPTFVAADPAFSDRVDLLSAGLPAGDATFAAAGSEQDALAEYLLDKHATTPFNDVDTAPAQDQRIQNLASRDDTVLANVEDLALSGGSGSSALAGGAGDDELDGNSGDDSLTGAAGNDTLEGGSGRDQLDGGVSNDLLQGGSNRDGLAGGGGRDTLEGGSGDDLLAGGAGDDLLEGGTGADRFYFGSVSDGVDRIADFRAARDVIDIADLLEGFDPSASDLDDFVQLVESGTDTVLRVDADGGGDKFQDLAILQGVTGIDIADLVDSGALAVHAAA